MKEITPKELNEKVLNNESVQIIDVREEHELEIASINVADHIPMGEIISRIEEIKKDIPVYIMCRSGKRSANTIMALEQQFGLDNLTNVTGGILAWAEEVDRTLEKY